MLPYISEAVLYRRLLNPVSPPTRQLGHQIQFPHPDLITSPKTASSPRPQTRETGTHLESSTKKRLKIIELDSVGRALDMRLKKKKPPQCEKPESRSMQTQRSRLQEVLFRSLMYLPSYKK